MMVLRIDACMACAKMILSNCFDERPQMDCQRSFDFFVLG